MKKIISTAVAVLTLVFHTLVVAEVPGHANALLSNKTVPFFVHPVYPPDQAEQVFASLLSYLNEHCECTLELVTFRDFHAYRRAMTQGFPPGFVLEEAHLASMRIERYGYQPIVRDNAEVRYHLVALRGGEDQTQRDLVGRPVATMASPSMGYIQLDRWFPDPVQAPIFKSDARSWQDAVEMVFAGEAVAAVVPDSVASQYPNLETLRYSASYPSSTVLANPAVPPLLVSGVKDAMLRLASDENQYETLNELGIAGFQQARPLDYIADGRIARYLVGY